MKTVYQDNRYMKYFDLIKKVLYIFYFRMVLVISVLYYIALSSLNTIVLSCLIFASGSASYCSETKDDV